MTLQWTYVCFFSFLFLKVLFIFRERGKEGETHQCVRERNNQLLLTRPQLGTWPTTQTCALPGNRTSHLLVHRWALNPLSHTSQGSLFSFELVLWVSLDKFPEVESLGHQAVPFLIFQGNCILLSTVATAVSLPTSSAKGFPFPHILASTCCLLIHWWWPFWQVWGHVSLWF